MMNNSFFLQTLLLPEQPKIQANIASPEIYSDLSIFICICIYAFIYMREA